MDQGCAHFPESLTRKGPASKLTCVDVARIQFLPGWSLPSIPFHMGLFTGQPTRWKLASSVSKQGVGVGMEGESNGRGGERQKKREGERERERTHTR